MENLDVSRCRHFEPNVSAGPRIARRCISKPFWGHAVHARSDKKTCYKRLLTGLLTRAGNIGIYGLDGLPCGRPLSTSCLVARLWRSRTSSTHTSCISWLAADIKAFKWASSNVCNTVSNARDMLKFARWYFVDFGRGATSNIIMQYPRNTRRAKPRGANLHLPIGTPWCQCA